MREILGEIMIEVFEGNDPRRRVLQDVEGQTDLEKEYSQFDDLLIESMPARDVGSLDVGVTTRDVIVGGAVGANRTEFWNVFSKGRELSPKSHFFFSIGFSRLAQSAEAAPHQTFPCLCYAPYAKSRPPKSARKKKKR